MTAACSNKSNDAGATWTLVNGDRNIVSAPFIFPAFRPILRSRDTVYA